VKVAIVDHVGIKAGMDCYDLSLYKALRKQGCETMIYSNFESDETDIFNSFKFRISENILSFFRMTSEYRRISRDIFQRKVQQCIVHGFRFGFAEWLLIRMLKKDSVKIIMIVHDPASLIGAVKKSKWRKKIFELCDTLVVHNNFTAGELSKELNDYELKLAVIPHGHFIDTAVTATDPDAYKSKNLLDKGKKYLLFFGHIKKSKGLDLLLEGLVNTNPDIFLLIAGRMRKHSFDKYLELISRYSLHSRIKIFSGYVSPELRNELFQAADAVVLPYRKVFQSGVMLMAMSYGKAVIASDLLPNKEMITDRNNGFLFRAGDKDSLASTIEMVMADNEMRKHVAKQGKMYVQTNHDWNLIAAKWIKLFQK
jgi:D-inositol-3-phosphate glycosyltransferase